MCEVDINNIVDFKRAIYKQYHLYKEKDILASVHISIFKVDSLTKIIMQNPLVETEGLWQRAVFEQVLEPLLRPFGMEIYYRHNKTPDVDVYTYRCNASFENDERYIRKMSRVIITERVNCIYGDELTFGGFKDEDLASKHPGYRSDKIKGDEIIWMLQKYKVWSDEEGEVYVYRRE